MKHNPTLDDIIPLVTSFTNSTFKNCLGALIGGSYATGKNNSESDIDLLILGWYSEGVFIESYYYKGYKIQCIVIPFVNIDELFRTEVELGEGIYLSMFNVGKAIIDPWGHVERTIRKAKSIYAAGPKMVAPSELKKVRAIITTRLEDLEGGNNYEDLLFTSIDTYNRLIQYHSLFFRTWHKSSKYASSYLERHDKQFKDRLTTSFKEFVSTGSKRSMVGFVKDSLNKFGGEVHFSTTRKTTEDVQGDNFVLYINTSKLKNDITQIVNFTREFYSAIINYLVDVEYTFFYVDESYIYPQGIYVIFYAENKYIKEYLFPLIKMYQQNSEIKLANMISLWNYPFEVNPVEAVGNSEIQKLFIGLLTRVNNIFYEVLKKNEFSNQLSVSMLFSFIKQFKGLNTFKEDKVFKKFLAFSLKTNMFLNQRINNSSSMDIRKYYYQLDIRKFKDSFQATSLLWEKGFSYFSCQNCNEIQLLLLEIENYLKYIEKKEMNSFWEETKIKYKQDELTNYLFVMFYKVLEHIQRLLFIEPDYKPYAIYCALRTLN